MLLGPLFVALCIAMVAVPLMMRAARRTGLVDLPDARKQHHGAVPLVGGVAIFTAAALALFVSGAWPKIPAGFVAAAAVILLVGFLDDARDLNAVVRFVAQAAAIGFAVTDAGHLLPDLGQLLGGQTLTLGRWAALVTVFGILGIVNAMNLVDGVDGLAGGIAATTLGWMTVAYALLELTGAVPLRGYELPVLGAMLGGVAGFLFFNLRRRSRRRASVFLGDAGSLLLGFVLGWFAVGVTAAPGDADMPPAAVLWLLWVPLYDTVGVMTRRLLAGRSPMAPDREHLHHLFQALGFTPRQTVNRLIAMNFVGGAIGVLGWQAGVPDAALFGLFLLGFAIYLGALRWVWRKLKAPLPSVLRAQRRAARARAAGDTEVAAADSAPTGRH